MMSHEQALELVAGYVLGALEPEEEHAVREHLASCSEPHEELAQLGGVVPYLAEAVDVVEPPASLRDRVLRAAAEDLVTRRAATERAATERPADERAADERAADERAADERAARGRVRTSPATWALRIAAVVVIGVLGAWNLLLQQQLSERDDFRDAVAVVLEAAAQEGSQAAILSSAGGDGPRGIAALTADGRIQLAMQGLPPTRGSQVYEAWIVGADGTPVPVGGFVVDEGGTAGFEARTGLGAPNVTIALTLEPAPNAKVPTLPLVAAGVATAPPG